MRLVLQHFLVDKQPACWPLLVEDYANKIKVNSVIQSRRFYRSSPHLSVVLGTWRALLCGEVLVWVPDGDDLQRFLADG